MRQGRRFQYELETLRLVSEWDLGQARQHLARLGEQVKAQESKLKSLDDTRRAACDEGRQGVGDMAPILLDAQRMRHAYLRRVGDQMQIAHVQLTQLAQAREQALQNALSLQRYSDGIEQHRSERQREHRRAAEVLLAHEADEHWLQRQATRRSS
jgi:hypothetical protein